MQEKGFLDKVLQEKLQLPNKKKRSFQKILLEKETPCKVKEEIFQKQKNGSSLEGRNSKEKLQKFVLCVEDQATLQRIVQKMRKQQSFLNKHRFMHTTLLSLM